MHDPRLAVEVVGLGFAAALEKSHIFVRQGL